MKEQYDALTKEYEELANVDPSKNYVQYPEALRLLGKLEGKTILDAGCGGGTFSRMLAKRGAKVIGYDISSEQIKLAKKHEQQNPLGIKYLVANPLNIEEKLGQIKFDLAVSTLVLLYAKDHQELEAFFSSTFNLLKPKEKFVSITFNPEYKRLGIAVYNRIFAAKGNKIEVNLFENGERPKCSAHFTKFTKKDYENAAESQGLSLQWEKLKIRKEGIKKLGKEFWEGYEQDCPYIGLVVKKQ